MSKLGWIVVGVVALVAIGSVTDDEKPVDDDSSVEAAPSADQPPGADGQADASEGSAEPVTASGEDESDEAVPDQPPEPETYRVASVTDGDTLVLANGEEVRLVGIDAPETGDCGSQRAEAMLARLTQGQRVTLLAPVRDRDRYDRLLRYVDVGSLDTGLRLVRSGLAIARYDSRDGYEPHARQQQYVRADAASPAVVCAPPEPVPFAGGGSSCAPGYSPCIPSYPPDLDCADTGPVTVTGSDPHGLDGDGDGVACGGD
jgi:endonuclease YncB( thermonuclease family)